MNAANPQEILAGAQRRLIDLRTFQLPRLQKCRGPLDLQKELGEEMRCDLEGVRRNLELCRELGEAIPRYSERQPVLENAHHLLAEVSNLRIAYREALITSKRNIDSIRMTKRHDLLNPTSSSGSKPSTSSTKAEEPGFGMSVKTATRQRVDMGGEDALQSKTNEVTDALRRTTNLMQAELERSVLSVQMLDESTRTLRLTETLYTTYSSLLRTSSHLVKALERADWYDRLVIGAAFLLFLVCCGWVVKRRVLDRVVGGVGWWVGASARLVGLGFGFGGKGKVVGKGVGKVVGGGLGKVGQGLSGLAGGGAGVGLMGGGKKAKSKGKESGSIKGKDARSRLETGEIASHSQQASGVLDTIISSATKESSAVKSSVSSGDRDGVPELEVDMASEKDLVPDSELVAEEEPILEPLKVPDSNTVVNHRDEL